MNEHITLVWSDKFRELIKKHKEDTNSIIEEYLVYCYEREEELNSRL